MFSLSFWPFHTVWGTMHQHQHQICNMGVAWLKRNGWAGHEGEEDVRWYGLRQEVCKLWFWLTKIYSLILTSIGTLPPLLQEHEPRTTSIALSTSTHTSPTPFMHVTTVPRQYRAHALSIRLLGVKTCAPTESLYLSLVPPQSPYQPQPTLTKYPLRMLQQSPTGIERMRSVPGFWGAKHFSSHSLVPCLHHSPKQLYILHTTPQIYLTLSPPSRNVCIVYYAFCWNIPY